MKQRLLAITLTAALATSFVAPAPALANGAAILRGIVLLGTAAGLAITNYNHKVHEKRREQQEVTRRQSAYRDWFHNKYGYYPTNEQFKEWYVQTYRVNPG